VHNSNCLDCLLYLISILPFDSQYDGLQAARDWGFKSTKLAKKSIKEVFEFI
jgi:DNA ligase (NAD+)